MNFKGAAKKIDDIDLPTIGKTIGVGEDVMHGIIDVESRGSGFDKSGRPKMLFEPHIFYRHLTGKQRDTAVSQGLAYKKWKRNYPKDSYPRLLRAMEINTTAALKACSWGMGQVMGFNHVLAGYSTVQKFVDAMVADEENHLKAMVSFIKNTGLDDELRHIETVIKTRKVLPDDCVGFVSGYNGKGFRKNNYHVNFANSVNKWVKIPDTPIGNNTKNIGTVNPTQPKVGWLSALLNAFLNRKKG